MYTCIPVNFPSQTVNFLTPNDSVKFLSDENAGESVRQGTEVVAEGQGKALQASSERKWSVIGSLMPGYTV